MSWLYLSSTARNAACNAIVDLLDAGGTAGSLKIYKGDYPGVGVAASASDLLATLVLDYPAFASASNGIANAGTITADTSADATGTATWARLADSSGNTVFDADVGVSNATVILNTVNIVATMEVAITVGAVTMPSGE